MDSERINLPKLPDQKVNVKKIFGIDSDLTVLGFKEKKLIQHMYLIKILLCLFLQALSMIEEL
jgi:hypothetical protein